MYKIEIFIPREKVDELRAVLAEAGAGKVGNYDHCISYYEVLGFWRPLAGANPHEGTVGEISSGREMKVEVRCEEKRVRQVIEAVRRVHPYEEPLINIVALENKRFMED